MRLGFFSYSDFAGINASLLLGSGNYAKRTPKDKNNNRAETPSELRYLWAEQGSFESQDCAELSLPSWWHSAWETAPTESPSRGIYTIIYHLKFHLCLFIILCFSFRIKNYKIRIYGLASESQRGARREEGDKHFHMHIQIM